MTRTTIGGPLGMRELALLHRPRSRQEMRVAAVEMQQRGMTDDTIAVACGLSVESVRELLGQRVAA